MQHKSIRARELGLDLSKNNEVQLFEWLLACLLFGRPIRQSIAKRAHQLMLQADVTSLDKLLDIEWDKLVAILDDAHYVHYDYSMATQLQDVARSIKQRFGSVKGLLKMSPDIDSLQANLLSFRGIGPVTAQIFIKGIAPFWYMQPVDHDYSLAIKAAKILHRHGYEAYLVGGAVRDLWLGFDPKDFDLATNATPDEIDQICEFTHPYYSDTAREYGISRISLNNSKVIEIAPFRKDIYPWMGRKQTKVVFTDLENDVLRRDLTINALALDPLTRQVIDYVDGISDLYDKRIRFIGDALTRIREDPIRLLRAIRIKNRLGFTYDPSVKQAITQAVQEGYIAKISPDKLRQELGDILVDASRVQALLDMDNFGILSVILPEVAALRRVEQSPKLHGDSSVWQHTLSVMRHLPPNPNYILVWAALLHDIGEQLPQGIVDRSEDVKHSPEHAAIGADLAKLILRRLHFTRKDSQEIRWIIQNHLVVEKIMFMEKKQLHAMFKNPSFENLLELYRADESSAWKMGRQHLISRTLWEIEKLWHKYSLSPKLLKKDLGIDTSWIVEQFGVEFDLHDSALVKKTLQYLDTYYQEYDDMDIEQYKVRARYYLLKRISGVSDKPSNKNDELVSNDYEFIAEQYGIH